MQRLWNYFFCVDKNLVTTSILGSILNIKLSSQDLEWRKNILETGQGLVWSLSIEYRKRKRMITILPLGVKSLKWNIYKEGRVAKKYRQLQPCVFFTLVQCSNIFVWSEEEGLVSLSDETIIWNMGWIWRRGLSVCGLWWNNYSSLMVSCPTAHSDANIKSHHYH